MKSVKIITMIGLLAVICLNTYSQTLEEWIFSSVSGRWYLTGMRWGLIGGGIEPVSVNTGDSIRINRVPGTDSITWKKYHNCLLEFETKYKVTFSYDFLSQEDRWLMFNEYQRFLFGYYLFPDGFSLTNQAYDGESYIYSRLDTIGSGETPVIPGITGIAESSRCGPGTLKLGASADPGTINWYTLAEGGTAVAVGESFMTPGLSNTTVYYIDASNNGCFTTPRTAVLATIKPVPVITSITDGSRCGSGTIRLEATTGADTINWYADMSDGSLVATGTSFTTPDLTVTTVYYAEAINNGCSSPARTAVTAIISRDDSCLTGITIISFPDRFLIYPNPATDRVEILIIDPFENGCRIELFNNLGSLIKPISLNRFETSIHIDLSEYPEGLYFIKCITDKGTFQYKIIKE
jgi:hypothetical protein